MNRASTRKIRLKLQGENTYLHVFMKKKFVYCISLFNVFVYLGKFSLNFQLMQRNKWSICIAQNTVAKKYTRNSC